ncbi:MAG: SBBP repeat-containing protein [Methanoregula sp.]
MVIRNLGRILLGILLLIVLVQGVFAEETCTFVRMWGSYEGGSNTTANGVAIDSNDNIYVTDTGNNRILEFPSDGSMITFWDLKESEYRQSEVPYGIAVDSSGNVYVADTGNKRIQKFSPTGTFLANGVLQERATDNSRPRPVSPLIPGAMSMLLISPPGSRSSTRSGNFSQHAKPVGVTMMLL